MPEIIAVVIRAAIAFFLLLLMTRLMGKTQLSQLNFFDYVVGITIGSTASTLATNTETPVVAGVTSILVWSGLAMAIDRLTLKNLYASKIIEGEPSVIIKNGKLMEEAMAKANIHGELMTRCGNRGFDFSQVRRGGSSRTTDS